MTEFLRITIVLVFAVNAAAVAGRVPAGISGLPAGPRAAMLGAGLAIAAGFVAVAGALHEPVLDGLEVEAETFRLGAGIVAIVGGVRVSIAPRRIAPTPRGWAGALSPLAFPLFLTPELTALTVSYAADDGAARTASALGAASVVSCVLATWLTGRRDAWHMSLVAGMARFAGAILAVVGVGLVVDGVRSI